MHGRVTIVKVILICQYTYIVTFLDVVDEATMDQIQCIINTFIDYNRCEARAKKSNWIPNGIIDSSSN